MRGMAVRPWEPVETAVGFGWVGQVSSFKPHGCHTSKCMDGFGSSSCAAATAPALCVRAEQQQWRRPCSVKNSPAVRGIMACGVPSTSHNALESLLYHTNRQQSHSHACITTQGDPRVGCWCKGHSHAYCLTVLVAGCWYKVTHELASMHASCHLPVTQYLMHAYSDQMQAKVSFN